MTITDNTRPAMMDSPDDEPTDPILQDSPPASEMLMSKSYVQEGPDLPSTMPTVQPTVILSTAFTSSDTHQRQETQKILGITGSNFSNEQCISDNQALSLVTESTSYTTGDTSQLNQAIPEIHEVGDELGPEERMEGVKFIKVSLDKLPLLHSLSLGMAADVVDDLEKVRNANQNRLRQMIASPDGDVLDIDLTTEFGSKLVKIVGANFFTENAAKGWKGRGFGLPITDSHVLNLILLTGRICDDYDEAVKNLQKTMKDHPLGKWCKNTSGVGEKQLARLLSAIGDPYWHYREDRPRTVSELWAYSGYHVLHSTDQKDGESQKSSVGGVGLAPRRKKGEKINWCQAARMRTRLISESCLKATTSPYRAIYYATREQYAEAVHTVPCAQCGPKGNPAQIGTPLNKGHQHARGLRKVAKEILKDLWVESKRIHELEEGSNVS